MSKAKRKNQPEDSGSAHPCCPPVILAEPLPEPKEEQFWPLPNSEVHNRVAHMLLLGLGPREIAGLLNVAYDKFCRWYLNASTQNYLMARRNEEAEKRRREIEKNNEENF